MLMARSDKNTSWHLYVLRLEDGKFYVGITSKTPEIRMQEHLDGIRSAYWTAKHKPIEIIHTEDLGFVDKSKAEMRENRMVRALMKQRGLNNVRGGDLRSVEPYIIRFGYVCDKERWDSLMYVLILIMFITYLLVDKYFLRS
jgi:predicted GIY-YIG superfamily endonuclease